MGSTLRTALMTQGQRNPRVPATTRSVRAALPLFLLMLTVGLAAAQEPPEPGTGLPEGPPFAPSLKPEYLALVRDNSGMPTLSPNLDDRRAEGEFFAYL